MEGHDRIFFVRHCKIDIEMADKRILASFSDSASFERSTGYMLLPATQPAPCAPSTRWNFATENAFETPPAFTKQSAGPGAARQPPPCEVVMSDGRQFTDYRPHDVTQLHGAAPMASSHDFRQMRLQQGERIRQTERRLAHDNVAPTCKFRPCDIGTMLPEQDAFVCDKIGCKRVDTPYACWGLGTGRAAA